MQTTMQMQEVRNAAKMVAQGRETLRRLFPNLNENQLEAIASIAMDDAQIAAETPNVAPVISNLARLPVVAASGEKPSLRNGIITVLKARHGKGEVDVSADAIFKELESRGWVPNSKDPRNYVGHVLSTYPALFERGKERGTYKLAKGVDVLPEQPKTTAPKTNGTASADEKKMATPPLVKDAADRIIKVLKKSSAPFSIGDVAKATKIPNHRQVTALVMTMLKNGAVKKLPKKSKAGSSMFSVNRDKFNEFVKGLAG